MSETDENRPPFDAQAAQLKTFLLSAEQRYFIPDYQREFSWGPGQVEAYWEDLVSLDNPPGKFMGTFLLTSGKNPDEYEIVDGQQRATIATITLAALRDVASKLHIKKLAERIQRLDIQIESRDDGELGEYRLTTAPSNLEFFRKAIQKFPSEKLDPTRREEDRIRKAYDYLVEQIEEQIQTKKEKEGYEPNEVLGDLRDRIRNLRVVLIKLFDPQIKFEVFESVNATGLELRPSDLTKNFLISKNQAQRDFIGKKWQEISDASEEIGLPLTDVIRYHWNGTETFTTTKNLFENIKAKCTAAEKAKSLIEEVAEAAECLAILKKGSEEDVRSGIQGEKKHAVAFQQAVQILRLLGTKQHYVLFLSLYRHRKNLPGGHVAKLANAVARFSVAHFGLCQGAGNRVERLFAKHARKINEAAKLPEGRRDGPISKAFDDALNDLKKKWPTPLQMQEALDGLRYEPNKDVRELLRVCFALIEMNSGGGGEIKLDWDTINIEHIQPQNPRDPEAEAIFIKHVHKLGNLTLLSEQINREIGNKIPAEKVPALLKSNLLTTRAAAQMVKDGGWTPEAIDKRTADIVGALKEILKK